MRSWKPIFALSLLAALSVGIATASDQAICGGYSLTAASDRDVLSAAQFAVREASKQEKKTIKLVAISQAEKQIVAGVNYRMILIVSSGVLNRTVRAVVYQNLDSKYSLSQWSAE